MHEIKDNFKLSNDYLDFIINTIDAIIYIIDLQTHKILYSNKKAKDEFGDIDNKICYKVLQKDKNSPCEECILSKPINSLIENNSLKWEHFNTLNKKKYLFSEKIIKLENKTLAKIQIGIDITKEKELERKVYEEKDKTLATFEALSNSTIEGLLIFSEDKKCIKTNDVILSLLGYTFKEMEGRDALDFIAPSAKEHVKKVIMNEDQSPYEAEMIKKDGTVFPAIIRGKDIILNDKIVRVSAVMDITAIKEKEAQISKLAYYDSLTLLPNRTFFIQKVNQFMKRSKYHKKYGALMFLDLDHFKIINDTKGHMTGDKILIECATRIVNTVREYDVVSRFGGDEFVILIDTEEKDEISAANISSIIANKLLKELRKTIILDDNEFKIDASIGIVTFVGNEEKIETLMRHADTAMYHSKEIGRGSYSFFDPKLQFNMERKVILTEKLRKAIESNNIEIYFQEQVDSNHKIIGIELLSRWNDNELGFISPDEFIPLAEDSGLILKLGKYILNEAAIYLNKWKNDEIKKDWKISVNLSLVQFEKENLIPLIKNIMDKYSAPKNRLKLEITESLLLKNTQDALKKIEELNQLGIEISIDDFGTGYSSLSYLKKLQINELKIDKSFIMDILSDRNDEIIVQAIIDIGNKFGFEVIAEGVESDEIYKKLIQMNCTYFQGFYFGKPKKLS